MRDNQKVYLSELVQIPENFYIGQTLFWVEPSYDFKIRFGKLIGYSVVTGDLKFLLEDIGQHKSDYPHAVRIVFSSIEECVNYAKSIFDEKMLEQRMELIKKI